MKSTLWRLFAGFLGGVLVPAVCASHGELDRRFKVAQQTFEAFFKTVHQTSNKTLDYNSFVGTMQDRSSDWPGTVYSHFLHLKRSYDAFSPVAKAGLEPEVVEAMSKALGDVSSPSQPSLISVLGAMSKALVKEKFHRDKLLFWLGQSTSRPSGALPISLPEAFGNVARPLFSSWKKVVTYSQDPSDRTNLFSLAHQISHEIAQKTVEEQKEITTWLGPVGSPEDDDPRTLFGQIMALQRLVEVVEEDHLPIPLAHFQIFLGAPKGLIGQALAESLECLQGKRVKRPEQRSLELMNSLSQLPRKVVQDMFVAVPKLWPPHKEDESIQQRLRSIAFRFEELGYLDKSPEWYGIRSTLGFLSKESYSYGSLLDAVATLASLISQASLSFDENDFEAVAPLVGLRGRPSESTLWGLLETISQQLDQPDKVDEKKMLALLGSPQDPLKRPGEETTVWGVLTALFEHFLLKAPLPGRQLYTLAQKIGEREDIPLGLKSLLSGDEPTTLFHRLQQLEKDVQDLIDQHHFEWADQLFVALSLHVPALEKTLQDILVAPASDLEALLSQAWWRSDGTFKDLNALFEVVRGGGAQKLFRPKETTPWGELKRLSLRTFDWYRKEWQSLMLRAPLKKTDMAQRLGVVDRGGNGVTLESAQNLWERLNYLSEMIPLVALQEPTSGDEEALWKSWMQHVVDTKQGVAGFFYLLTQDLDKFSLESSEEKDPSLWERISQAVEEIHPRSGTLSALLQSLLEDGFRAFLQRSVASHRAQRHGWFLQDSNSLRHSLLEVQRCLRGEKHPQVLKALRWLGTEADGPFAPTIFGQLTACEDLLFRLWEERLRLPLQACSQVAARLTEKLWGLQKDGWTDTAWAQLGDSLASPDEDSVAGLLSQWRSCMLAGYLERGLALALSKTQEFAKELATYPVLQVPDRLRVLLQILPPKDLGTWPFFTEALAEVDFDEDDPFATLSQGLSFLLRALEPVKGCLYLNHAQQGGCLVAAYLASLGELKGEFDGAKKAFDPGIPIYKPALADKALDRLDGRDDRAEATLVPAKPTLRGLVQELALRFHYLYTSLPSWLTSESLKNIDKNLATLEKSWGSNSTALTPFVRSCDRCSNVFSACAALLKEAGEQGNKQGFEPLEKRESAQHKRDLLKDLCETLWNLRHPVERLAHVLPCLWGQGVDAQSVDLYPFCEDVVEGVISCADRLERLLNFLYGVTVPQTVTESQQQSLSLEEALSGMVQTLQECSQALTERVQILGTGPSYAEDLAETGEDLFRCAMALSCTRSLDETLANELSTANRGAVELASVARCVGQSVLALRELEEALTYGGQLLCLQAGQQPLQLAKAALQKALSSNSALTLAEQVAGLQEGGQLGSQGQPLFEPNSLIGLAESRQQSLSKILPQYREYSPESLAEQAGKSFPF